MLGARHQGMAAADILVGRTAELEAIDGSLAVLRSRWVKPVLVIGEPGIGKTRLLAELAARADAGRCTVLTGSASELEQDLPFWLFVDALDEYAAGLDPRVVRALDDEIRSELAQVLPAFAAHAGDGRPLVQDERYRTHRAIRELLERLAVNQPLVLVLDDVHWADPGSIELLIALLRRPPDAPMLLALGMRPQPISGRLLSALERAELEGAVTRLALRGLDRHQAAELLGRRFGGDRADTLYEESGGNPFYLQQLGRAPGAPHDDAAKKAESALVDVGVPRAVIASLAAELALLDDETRLVLRGAAVAGDPFELELAAAAADVEEAAAMRAIDELLRFELIRAGDVPRRFRFRHPLVRRAVYHDAPGGWRLGAHERCAQALAASGAPVTARAHHVEQAARRGDSSAIAVLTEAGRSASLRAPGSAAQWYSAALRLLPDGAPLPERIELQLSRARASAAVGRLMDAREDLVGSLALVPETAPELRLRLSTSCARVEHLLGRHEQAHARLLAVLESLTDLAGPEALALRIELATDAVYRADWNAMRAHALEAVQLARGLGDRAWIAGAVATVALADALAGAIARGEETCTEAARIVDELADEELAANVDAGAFLARAELFLSRYAQSRAHAQRAYALGRAAGAMHPTIIPTLGMTHVMLGRIDEAVAILDTGVEAARLADVDQAVAFSLLNRAVAAVYAGDTAAALAMAEEAMQRARGVDANHFTAWVDIVLAFGALDAGDGRRALDTLMAMPGAAELPTIPGVWRVMGLELLVRAFLMAGRPQDAAAAAERARSVADTFGLTIADAWAKRAAAHVALDAGKPADAAGLALAAADAADRAGVALEAAISRVLAGQALARAGDDDAGASALEQAALAFEACGADRRREAAEQELRRLGRPMYRRSRPGTPKVRGIAALTGRELEIAHLVVDRRTNPEIAAELYLSLKTIESHMRNIFRKLGVSNRVQLAREVERAGVPSDSP
jgi:DNA-binding NarL/FixJ family response regulator